MQFNLQPPVTPIASQIFDLHLLITGICAVIFVVVFSVMFYSIFAHRKSKGHPAAQFHENTTVEVIWTVVPFLILLLMAATSHDFWLAFLTPPIWKSLHMGLYVAYGLVVMHVALGVMQYDRNPLIPAMLAGGFLVVTVLHLVAGWRERAGDISDKLSDDGWLLVGPPLSIPDQGARIVAAPGGERIAVFRDGARIGALSNLCAHQNGPVADHGDSTKQVLQCFLRCQCDGKATYA